MGGAPKLLQRWMTGSRTRPVRWFVLGLLGTLGGCAGPSSYEVDVPEPETPVAAEPAPSGTNWTVKPGDTLYSIAFSAGTDWHALAAANGIAPPYTIYPGQKLRLGSTPVMT